jgi:hypothetical protein
VPTSTILFSLLAFSFVPFAYVIQVTDAFIKITNPVENDKIHIDSTLAITGFTVDKGDPTCKVQVVVNGNFPYKDAQPLSSDREQDYSEWYYELTPDDTKLKIGENKITSKALCDNSHDTLAQDNMTRKFVKHDSVNITGIVNSVL